MTEKNRKRWKSLFFSVICGLIWYPVVGFGDAATIISPSEVADLPAVAVAKPTTAPGVARAVKQLDRQLGTLIDKNGMVGLAVAVAHNDQIVYSRTLGLRQHGSDFDVNSHTRFRIASLSKGFASTVAAQLVADGQLSWDESVANQVDYFRLPNQDATNNAQISHLLSHTVGLPHYAFDNLFDAKWEIPTIFARYPELPQLCPVGQCYGYQNLSYNAISDLIGRRTGQSFEQHVQHRLFTPLQMDQANFGLAGLKSGGNWAEPHTYRRKTVRRVAARENYYRLPAAAGINASLRDMQHWLLAQLGDHPSVISRSVLDELRKPRIETKREFRGRWRRTRLRNAHYGLGWRIYDYQGAPMIYHAGAVQGYRAQIAVLPDQDVALIAMWNSDSGRPWGITPTFTDSLLKLPARDWMQLSRD